MTLLGEELSLTEGVNKIEIEPDTALDNLDNIHEGTFNLLFFCLTFGHPFNFAIFIFWPQFSALALNFVDFMDKRNTYYLNVS